ncbi:nuclear transport factor 2 family protein [Nocardia implantans]|uniref:Nuclear transport factor 2 family protein n=1 Tax=Nocardia implantans TaxID=3108168 RepID=A0ABU6AYS9_9NOCA|nr:MULTISPECIES: nuclear transport factor 2 family protein [unclassified Nocardia]MBF6194383.1 nuclear transport factor 2 family protein [Nocardia beijingensis]MEA3529991.1 nuclear transport factor 2 family protein [Nocardia sp. CDC192]MEB3512531.1 nuclear transport factor 2 family protein [Nocardia sp. CDC186]
MTKDNTALRNKELLSSGFAEFAAGNLDVLRTLLHDDFLEHSPGNPSGKEAFLEFIAQAAVTRSKLELARVIADDDYVVMHYRMVPPGGEEPDLAVVDIWRVADGKIVEHWDVVQPVPDPGQIPHGMF